MRSAVLLSACKYWCLTMQPEIYVEQAETYDLWVLQGDSLLGIRTLPNNISGHASRCTTFKISVYESAGAVKHPVQTWSQVLLLLKINAEALKGRQEIYDGEARPWFGPLTLLFILNEVKGYRALLCTGPVYIHIITAEADRSNTIYWWNWINEFNCVCDRIFIATPQGEHPLLKAEF